MPQLVKAPDGSTLQFPDDMSNDEILTVMRQHYPPTAPNVAAPATKAAAPAPKAAAPAAKPRPSMMDQLSAGARAATREAIPTVLGAGPGMAMGAQLGAGAGTALGMVFPPAEVVTVPVGTVLGGLYGAYAGHKGVADLQTAALKHAPPQLRSMFGEDEAQRKADIAAYPTTTAVASALPGLAFGHPSAKIAENVLGGAFGAGTEAFRQSYSGEKADFPRIAAMGGVGMLQAKPTSFATKMLGTPETAFQRGARETVQPQGRRAQRPVADVSAEMRRTQSTLQGLRSPARPVDVMALGTTSKVLAPAAAASDEAARVVQKYAEGLKGPGAEGTQVLSQRAAAEIAPEIKGATAQELGAKAAEEITAAGEAVQPGVPLGEATTATAKKLAAEEAAARKNMQEAYAKQEKAGVATVEMPREGQGPWKQITPRQAQQYAKGMPNPPEDPLLFNAQTSEVRPRSSFGPMNVAEFNAELRDPISGFMEDPESIKPVLNVLSALEKDSVSTLDTSNIFGARKRLSAIERDFGPQTPQGIAAGRVRRKLDDVVNIWQANNRFSGAPEVVDQMGQTTAIAKKYYSDFKSGDITQQLTEQQYARGAREMAVDPEAARKVIFGALKDTNTSLSNLKVLRDRLGANSPEWDALRKEAVEQIVGTETDKGKFIKSREKFERENPAMAGLLLTPEERATFAAAKGRVEAATDIQSALKTGDAALKTLPSDFSAAVSGLQGAPLRAAKVALRSNLEQRLGTPDGALSVLGDLAEGTTARENVAKLLGGAEAEKLFRRAEVLAQRSKRAGSAAETAKSAQLGIPTGGAEGIRAAERAATGVPFLAPLTRFLEARGLNRTEALQTAQDALDPSKTEDVIKHIETLYGENAAQVFGRRVRANVARSELLGGLPARVARQGIAGVTAPSGEKPEAAKEEAVPDIGAPKSQEQFDKEMGDFFGTPAAEGARTQPVGPPKTREELHARVKQQESGGDPNAVSKKGAEGAMQVMRATQIDPGLGVEPPRNNSPAEKERVGHDYLDALLGYYRGDEKLALMAYNWGLGNVNKWLAGDTKPVPEETRNYVKAIVGGNIPPQPRQRRGVTIESIGGRTPEQWGAQGVR